MRVQKPKLVIDFGTSHSSAKSHLGRWLETMLGCSPSNFIELKELFPGVDIVERNCYIFNLGGTKYRLVAWVYFGEDQYAVVKAVYTHAEYSKKETQRGIKKMASLSFTPLGQFSREIELDSRLQRLAINIHSVSELIFAPRNENDYEELSDIATRIAELHSAAEPGNRRALKSLLDIVVDLMAVWEERYKDEIHAFISSSQQEDAGTEDESDEDKEDED